MHQYDACINESKNILRMNEGQKDGIAHAWISLSYIKLSILEKEISKQRDAFLELAKVFAVISLHCSAEKEILYNRLLTVLGNQKLLAQLKDIQVVEVDIDGNLREILRQQNQTNMIPKGKAILLFKPGIYNLPFDTIGKVQ